MFRLFRIRIACLLASAVSASTFHWTHAAAQSAAIPAEPLTWGFFEARFGTDGAFILQGQGWPTFKGTWTIEGTEVTLRTTPFAGRGGKPVCEGAGRYRVRTTQGAIELELVSDDCVERRMILDRSAWRRPGDSPPRVVRNIVTRPADKAVKLPKALPADGSWPSFRGPNASGAADGQRLPDRWNGETGENVLWRTPIPGLGHSSAIVWAGRVFVTTAVSSRGTATFRPGLYGDGDASDDQSPQKWMVIALDARTGKVVWERVASEGAPKDRRHIKSTYASATPATDGRVVIASFGSQGVYAYTFDGQPLWSMDPGRLDLGAYDIPSYEWGPASSPVIADGRVYLQYDTQADSFLLALDVDTGRVIWKTERDELPSWGTPTVAVTSAGTQILTNAARYVRGYDAKTGQELWRLGGSSKITAPTPIVHDGLFVIASGRAPERPVFVVRPEARGDLTLKPGETSNAGVVWSRTGRGPYMPTPLAYKGILYVLANNGLFDAYDLRTGEEIYRQRLQHLGSGFSASPVAADDRIYLSNEDGEMLVVAAGRTFAHIATNPMGELLMATPALSKGVMYVRSANSLYAIGQRTAGTR